MPHKKLRNIAQKLDMSQSVEVCTSVLMHASYLWMQSYPNLMDPTLVSIHVSYLNQSTPSLSQILLLFPCTLLYLMCMVPYPPSLVQISLCVRSVSMHSTFTECMRYQVGESLLTET